MAGTDETGTTPTGAGAFGFSDSTAAAASRFSPRDRLLGLTLLVVVLGASLWFVFNGDPSRAEHPDVYGGSVLIRYRPGHSPVVIDMAARRVTVQLDKLGQVVGDDADSAQLIPSPEGHYLLNPETGGVNLLGRENTVVNRAVPKGLDLFAAEGGAETEYAVVAADGGAYVMQVDNDRTEFVLVDREVIRAATVENPPEPIGAIQEAGAALTVPESARAGDDRRRRPRAVSLGPDLYVLVRQGDATRVLVLSPPAPPSGTTTTAEGTPPALQERWGITVSNDSELVSGPGVVAVADPSAGTLTTVNDGAETVQDAPALRDARLLPVRGSTDGAWVAARSTEGDWRIVGTPNPNPSAPLVLPLGGEQIAPPVFADGQVYSVDRTDGTTARVDLAGSGSTVIDHQPFEFTEIPPGDQFADAVVESRGDRVLVNAPASTIALISDGPDGWDSIDKRDASVMDPRKDPESIDDDRSTTTTPDPNATTTTLPETSTATIVLKEGCENTEQIPHKPVDLSTVGLPASRSVTLDWRYETQSADDCDVSVWNIKSREQGQQDWIDHELVSTTKIFTLGDLKTDTAYEIVVQARLGNQSKDSDPLVARTSDTDPPASPVDVVATASEGIVKVDWAAGCSMPCDPVIEGYEVVLRSADAVGPSPITLPTVRPTAALTASFQVTPELIGHNLVFSVVAKGKKTDAPEVLSNRVEAWTAPNFGLITVNAGNPVPDGTTQKVTIEAVTNSAIPGQAFGTTSPLFVFHLDNGESSAPSTNPAAEFRGLANNEAFTFWVEIRHHEKRWEQPATTREQRRTEYQPWRPPDFSASLDLTNPLSNSGVVTVDTVRMPDDLGTAFTVDPSVRCASSVTAAPTPLGPPLRLSTPDNLDESTSCSVRIILTERSIARIYDPALVDDPIDIAVPLPTPNPIQGLEGQVMAGTFRAVWSAERGKIDLSGPNPAPWGTWRWNGRDCPSDGVIATIDANAGCVDRQASTVALVGTYFGVDVSFTVPIAGQQATDAPGRPSIVADESSAGDGQVTVVWDAPTDDGGSPITGYTVTADPPTGPSGTCTLVPAAAVPLTCTVTGLVNGTTYTITVVATNSNGDGPASAPVLLRPTDQPAGAGYPDARERLGPQLALPIALPIAVAAPTSLIQRRRRKEAR